MPAPFYTSDPAEFSALPGVYVNDQDPPGFIANAGTSDFLITGECVRGPVGKVVEVDASELEGRFRAVFGGRDYGSGGAIVGKVWLELLNKVLGRVGVARVCAAADVAASFTTETAAAGGGTTVMRIDANGPGVWGNGVGWKVEDASDGDANHYNLRLRYLGATTLYENLDMHATGVDNSLTVLGTDDANLVVLTKLNNGRPVTNAPTVDGADADGYTLLGQTVANFTSVLGTTNATADADFTGTGKGINLIKAFRGNYRVCAVADKQTAAIKAAIKTAAAASNDREWVMWNGSHTADVAAAVADVATYRSDRVIYCYNSPLTLDPATGTFVTVPPSPWMAAIITQTAVDADPATLDAQQKYLAGISGLTFPSLERSDYKALHAAGISALEKNDDGYGFVSAVNTQISNKDKRWVTRRRSTDEIQLAGGAYLRGKVNALLTDANKNEMLGQSITYLSRLRDKDTAAPRIKAFAVSLDASLEDQGVEFLVWRVKLTPHSRALVLRTQIGETVNLQEAAA
jgi:hypothetical protein